LDDLEGRTKISRILPAFRSFEISYIMQVVYFKELAEKFQVIHVTEGLSPEQVRMMNFTYSPDLQEAIQKASKNLPQASVVIFPSGRNSIPQVTQRKG